MKLYRMEDVGKLWLKSDYGMGGGGFHWTDVRARADKRAKLDRFSLDLPFWTASLRHPILDPHGFWW